MKRLAFCACPACFITRKIYVARTPEYWLFGIVIINGLYDSVCVTCAWG